MELQPPPYHDEGKKDTAFWPLAVPVEGFSLASMCVMLRYIYTGELNLSADTALHAICTSDSSLVKSTMLGANSDHQKSIKWNPLDTDSVWQFKEVTWEELLTAAKHYGVSDLQQECETAVIAALNPDNVVKTLFTFGDTFVGIKDAAQNYLLQNARKMDLKAKNPFLPYMCDPMCCEILYELMRRGV